MTGETNLDLLISTMNPKLNSGQFVFCTIKQPELEINEILFYFREAESITLVCSKEYADQRNYAYSSPFAWITLQVHSALEAVGLTAAFSQELAKHDISCNVVAAYYHDHIFVQYEKKEAATKVLENLAAQKLAEISGG